MKNQEFWSDIISTIASKSMDEILKNPKYCYAYSEHVLNGRFEPGEQMIATDPDCSYYYAKHILKGRFRLGESTIAKDYMQPYNYCFHILNVSNNILKDDLEFASKYLNDFLDLEKKLEKI